MKNIKQIMIQLGRRGQLVLLRVNRFKVYLFNSLLGNRRWDQLIIYQEIIY